MLIDCDTCAVRDVHCGECVMTVLLREPAQPGAPAAYEVDEDEARALEVLAAGGLVPRLRLIPLEPARGHAQRPPEEPSRSA